VTSTRDLSTRAICANDVDSLPEGFRPITPADTPHLSVLFDQSRKQAWCYYIPFLNCYHLPPGRQVLLGTVRDATCILSRTDRKQTIYNLVVPPAPFDVEALAEVCDLLRDATAVDPRVLWCDAEDAERARSGGFLVEEKEREYIYDPARVAAMKGPEYKALRKRVGQAERRYAPEMTELQEGRLEECHDLLARWRRLQGRKHAFLLDWGYTKSALNRFDDWGVEDLAGWTASVGGQLAAFGMAGPITPDLACFFMLKSDPELPGLSEWLRYQIFRTLSERFQRVNDAGDLDLPGLRQHKRMFRPVDLRPVYSLHRS